MPQISHPKQISASDPPALRAVPSTLMIPLAARAHGQRWFPSLDCRDNLAMPTLQCLTANVNAYLADQPTVLNILWRTRRICEAGNAFFEQHPDCNDIEFYLIEKLNPKYNIERSKGKAYK